MNNHRRILGLAGLFFGIALFTLSAQAQYVSNVWVADRGDGTYQNPIIHADYSDPDVVRVDDDYFMTAYSFDAIPGLPILHSKDLVNWALVRHALRRPEGRRGGKVVGRTWKSQ